MICLFMEGIVKKWREEIVKVFVARGQGVSGSVLLKDFR